MRSSSFNVLLVTIISTFSTYGFANNQPLDVLQPGAKFIISQPVSVPPPSAIAFRNGSPRPDLGHTAGDANEEPYCMFFLNRASTETQLIPKGIIRFFRLSASGATGQSRQVVFKVVGIDILDTIGCYGPTDKILSVDVFRKAFGTYANFISP
jgi:hypothetical protein